MMKTRLFTIACFAVAVFVFAGSSSAYAACSDPAGDEADQVYNTSHNLMQYCDGTNWISMAADGDVLNDLSCSDGQFAAWDNSTGVWACADPTGSNTLGDLSCSDGQVAAWDNGGSEWVCADEGIGDDLGDHTATTDIDSDSNGIVNAGNFTFIGVEGDAPVSTVGAVISGVSGAGDCGIISTIDFPDMTGVPSTATETDVIVLVETVACSATVGVGSTGSAEYRICSNSDCSTVVSTWTSDMGTIEDGEYLQVRATAPSSEDTEITISLGVGSLSDSYNLYAAAAHKKVFATSTTTNGNFGGVAGADAMCAADALAYNVPGTFLAWVATTAGNDPDSRFTKSVAAPYRNAYYPYVKVVDDWADLVDASIDSSIVAIDDGSVATYVWTGIQQNGSLLDTRCSEWTSTGGNGRNGRPGTIGSKSWTNHNNDVGCGNQAVIYCFEQ